MERGVVPGQTELVDQALEPAEERLAQSRGVRLDRPGRRSRPGSPAAGPRGPCSGRGRLARGRSPRRRAAATGGGASARSSAASGAERNSVWPYSANRQHRPLSSTDRRQPRHLGVELGVERAQGLAEAARRRDRSGTCGCDSCVDPRGGRPDLLDAEPAGPGPSRGRPASTCSQASGDLDVLGPERPGLALDRPRGVDGAAGLLVPEDAVAARLLDQAVAVADPADEPAARTARPSRRGTRPAGRSPRRRPRRNPGPPCSRRRSGCTRRPARRDTRAIRRSDELIADSVQRARGLGQDHRTLEQSTKAAPCAGQPCLDPKLQWRSGVVG